MPQFYSVQSKQDAQRLAGAGEPWPTGLQRSNLGIGLYAWESRVTAEHYGKLLENRGASDLAIVCYEIYQGDLMALKALDLTRMTDEEVDDWMERFSHYGNAEPHEWEYVIRATDKGTEHYFAADVFAKFREVS